MRLKDRRILVTGAGSGIGFATATMLAQEGARLGLMDIDAVKLEAASGKIGPAATAFVADVSKEAEVVSAVDLAAAALGGIDGVVNCAGIDFIRPLPDTTASDWARIMGVNLNGPFHVCKASLAHLKREEFGTIVNIASAAGLRPLEHRTAYCASKAALVMFTKTLAAELSNDNIRANVVCPGIVETPLYRASFENAEDPDAELARIMDRYVIKRAGTADEIASAILFLTSRESSYITGAALAVDGGRSFH